MRYAILAVLATSCSGPQRRCTLEYRTLYVRVVDRAGQPVDHLETRTVFARTGRVVPVQSGVSLEGRYALADDGHARELADADGEVFRFEIMVDPPVTRDFVLRLDSCHIDIDSHPEPIVLPR